MTGQPIPAIFVLITPKHRSAGGLRVIYFWDEASETFYMLFAYPKNEQEDLTTQQLRVLSRLVREEFG